MVDMEMSGSTSIVCGKERGEPSAEPVHDAIGERQERGRARVECELSRMRFPYTMLGNAERRCDAGIDRRHALPQTTCVAARIRVINGPGR